MNSAGPDALVRGWLSGWGVLGGAVAAQAGPVAGILAGAGVAVVEAVYGWVSPLQTTSVRTGCLTHWVQPSY